MDTDTNIDLNHMEDLQKEPSSAIFMWKNQIWISLKKTNNNSNIHIELDLWYADNEFSLRKEVFAFFS